MGYKEDMEAWLAKGDVTEEEFEELLAFWRKGRDNLNEDERKRVIELYVKQKMNNDRRAVLQTIEFHKEHR